TKPSIQTQVENWPKVWVMAEMYGAIIGRQSILTLSYEDGWKELRSLFNPGFSHANIMNLLPSIVEQVEIFMQKMRDKVKEGNGRGFVESTEEWAMYLTSDIIFALVLGYRSRCQTRDGKGRELVHNIIELSKWPNKGYNLIMPMLEWWYEK